MVTFKSPWKQGEDEFSIYVEDSDGRIIADVREPIALVSMNLDERTELHRARARLLAAAPDLLEQLKFVTEVLKAINGTYHQTDALVAECSRIISKAEGRRA